MFLWAIVMLFTVASCECAPSNADIQSFNEALTVTLSGVGRIQRVLNDSSGGLILVSHEVLSRLDNSLKVDFSFGQQGSTLMSGFLHDAVIDTNGRYVVLGCRRKELGGDQMFLRRYLQSGVADPSFGDGGTVYFDDHGDDFRPIRVFVLPNGEIEVVGTHNPSDTDDVFVARFADEGKPIASFGSAGVRYLDPLPHEKKLISNGELEGDGAVVVVGYVSGSTEGVFVTRVTANGTLDATFGMNGTTYIARVVERVTMAIDSQRRITIIGQSYDTRSFFVTRLDADGEVDNTWGAMARAKEGDVITAMAIREEVFAVGERTFDTTTKAMLEVFAPDGSPDTSVGTAGVWIGDYNDWSPSALTFNVAGNLIVVGQGSTNVVIQRLARFRYD